MTAWNQHGKDLTDLMRAAQKGDGEAYRRLLREAEHMTRGYAIRRWGRTAAVDDLVQDVLVSIHTARRTFDPSLPFRPWLFAIVRNRMTDALRRNARTSDHEILTEFSDETFLSASTHSSEDRLCDHDFVHKAVGKLPQGQKQAVEMLKLKEMSLAEASKASGQSVAALKVAMHRAMKSLKLIARMETQDK